MAGFLAPIERWTVFQNGEPAAGAKLFSYLSGTSVPSPLYNNADLLPAHAHTNPVIADSTGTFPVLYVDYLNYRFLVTDALGVTIFPAQDNIRTDASDNTIQRYTPTLFNLVNITLAQAHTCQYLRVGNVVTVSGYVGLTFTAPNTLSQLLISLPIPSAFTSPEECGGTAAAPLVFGYVGGIVADFIAGAALLQMTIATDVSLRGWPFTFTYTVVA